MKLTGAKLAVSILSIALSQNAFAACSGISCEGRDPAIEGCEADAITGLVRTMGVLVCFLSPSKTYAADSVVRGVATFVSDRDLQDAPPGWHL
jgi:hypothetical protein